MKRIEDMTDSEFFAYQTVKPATHRGFEIVRGDYSGTSDNRADGWYIDRIGADLRDRRGPGFATAIEARIYIDDQIDGIAVRGES